MNLDLPVIILRILVFGAFMIQFFVYRAESLLQEYERKIRLETRLESEKHAAVIDRGLSPLDGKNRRCNPLSVRRCKPLSPMSPIASSYDKQKALIRPMPNLLAYSPKPRRPLEQLQLIGRYDP
jgi:hypothetical protein